jgi:hypothetical protein
MVIALGQVMTKKHLEINFNSFCYRVFVTNGVGE